MNNINFNGTTSKVSEIRNQNLKSRNDSFEKTTNAKPELTTEQKQEIMQKARTKASGFAIFFGLFDTLYYGLRFDKTVAKIFFHDF